MKPDLDQVLDQLKKASQSLSAGQLEQACARLTTASSLLDSCIAECAQGQGPATDREAVPNLQPAMKAALAMAG